MEQLRLHAINRCGRSDGEIMMDDFNSICSILELFLLFSNFSFVLLLSNTCHVIYINIYIYIYSTLVEGNKKSLKLKLHNIVLCSLYFLYCRYAGMCIRAYHVHRYLVDILFFSAHLFTFVWKTLI